MVQGLLLLAWLKDQGPYVLAETEGVPTLDPLNAENLFNAHRLASVEPSFQVHQLPGGPALACYFSGTTRSNFIVAPNCILVAVIQPGKESVPDQRTALKALNNLLLMLGDEDMLPEYMNLMVHKLTRGNPAEIKILESAGLVSDEISQWCHPMSEQRMELETLYQYMGVETEDAEFGDPTLGIGPIATEPDIFASNPFGSGSDQVPSAGQASDTFGGSSGGDPFGTGVGTGDPFGGDPFGGGSSSGGGDPFGGDAFDGDPFGASNSLNGGDPLGNEKKGDQKVTSAPTSSNPFAENPWDTGEDE